MVHRAIHVSHVQGGVYALNAALCCLASRCANACQGASLGEFACMHEVARTLAHGRGLPVRGCPLRVVTEARGVS